MSVLLEQLKIERLYSDRLLEKQFLNEINLKNAANILLDQYSQDDKSKSDFYDRIQTNKRINKIHDFFQSFV